MYRKMFSTLHVVRPYISVSIITDIEVMMASGVAMYVVVLTVPFVRRHSSPYGIAQMPAKGHATVTAATHAAHATACLPASDAAAAHVTQYMANDEGRNAVAAANIPAENADATTRILDAFWSILATSAHSHASAYAETTPSAMRTAWNACIRGRASADASTAAGLATT